jgi:succinyl-diaminopimelate desuccinylase
MLTSRASYCMRMASTTDRVLAAVDALREETVAFTSALIRIPTINPPGEHYEDCARFIGETLASLDFAVEYYAAEGRPEHTRTHPRLNVVGARHGRTSRPLVHLNGHIDVVPAGEGWTVDPFGGDGSGDAARVT